MTALKKVSADQYLMTDTASDLYLNELSVWELFKGVVFLGVPETIVGSFRCCGVRIVDCLLNLLYYVI